MTKFVIGTDVENKKRKYLTHNEKPRFCVEIMQLNLPYSSNNLRFLWVDEGADEIELIQAINEAEKFIDLHVRKYVY